MYTLQYELQLNENGRPCIALPDDYENNPEDRFFSIEMSRYILQNLSIRKKDILDENTLKHLDNTINLLGQISDEMAKILFDGMCKMGEVEMILKPKYHIQVKSIEDRNILSNEFIFYGGKVFNRIEGLRVLVTEEMEIYELNDGITNENWRLI